MSKMLLKPSKQISGFSVIMLVFMLIFGIGFIFLVGNTPNENDNPPMMSFMFYLVIIMFIGAVLYMIVYHSRNYGGAKDNALIEIEKESGFDNSPMQRLRELESLKKDGLLNEGEFEIKRKQILEEKW